MPYVDCDFYDCDFNAKGHCARHYIELKKALNGLVPVWKCQTMRENNESHGS